jgi:hypothetical protein
MIGKVTLLSGAIAAIAVGMADHVAAPAPDTATPASNRVAALGAACDIKGNISYGTGERIYHVRGQERYDGTVITASKGERWFCSEPEAQAAGWRRAGR